MSKPARTYQSVAPSERSEQKKSPKIRTNFQGEKSSSRDEKWSWALVNNMPIPLGDVLKGAPVAGGMGRVALRRVFFSGCSEITPAGASWQLQKTVGNLNLKSQFELRE